MADRKRFVVPNADDVEKSSVARPQIKPLFRSAYRSSDAEKKDMSATEKTSGIVSRQFGKSPESKVTSERTVTVVDLVEDEVPSKKTKGMTFSEAFADLKETKHFKGQSESSTTTTVKSSSSNSIIVNTKQKGNPILKHIRNVSWEYGDIVADYVMGKTTCALYLSIRYHNLKPDYIHDRLKQLGHSYELRILLVQVDVKDPHHAVKDLTKIAIRSDCTLILAWTPEEVGRYLETYKSYENKPADILKEKVQSDFMSRATDCLTTVKKVNKTDVVTLLSSFQSIEGIIKASKEELSLCPGFGPQKAYRLQSLFDESFIRSKHSKKNEPQPSTSKQ